MRIESKRFTIGLVLLASLLLPSVTLAQSRTAPTRDWSALKAVESGSNLVVKLKNGKTVKGKLSGVSDNALSLSVSGNPTDLSRDDILKVHQIGGKSATKATLIGLGVGAGTGAALGAAAGDSGGFIFIKKSEAAAALSIVGAGVGALAGFLIGKSGHKRVLVYEAK